MMRCLPPALACALLVSACGDRPAPAPVATPAPATKPASSEPAARRERPRLQVTTLDGAGWDLAERRGRWVVVNFWATWCGPCIKEMPELSALDAMREDVEVIGLAYEDIDAAAMRAFLAKRPVVYPVAIVDTYSPPADFDTPRGLPMTVLIAPDGRVAKQVVGPVTAAMLEQTIAAAAAPRG
jgi:thiol-disulfide isomerase/thioredoxin